MFTQSTLFAALLCLILLIRVNSSSDVFGVTSDTAAGKDSAAMTLPSSIELSEAHEKTVVLYDTLGMVVPTENRQQKQPKNLLEPHRAVSDEDYEELPRSCWDHLCCRRRRVPKFKSPRYSVTVNSAPGRFSRAMSMVARHISNSMNSQAGEAGDVRAPRNHRQNKFMRDMTFQRKRDSTTTDRREAEAPATSRPPSSNEPHIPRNMTEGLDGEYYVPSPDMSVSASSTALDPSSHGLAASATVRSTRSES